MFFFVARYMIMHFSCIRTILFSLFGISIDFSLSLSLSLSLSIYIYIYISFSLSDSLHMTPKRESTPSQNPLHFEALSSSDSTSLHIWFHDDKAHQDFSENFSKHGIHSEHHLILSNFFDTNLPTVINSRG